jgi:hypothetical protein
MTEKQKYMTNTYAGDMYHTNPIQADVILNIDGSALILIPHNFLWHTSPPFYW